MYNEGQGIGRVVPPKQYDPDGQSDAAEESAAFSPQYQPGEALQGGEEEELGVWVLNT